MEAFTSLMQLQSEIVSSAPRPVRVIVAGGAAVHYWTRQLVTADVDAEFLERVMVTEEQVAYAAQGGRRSLYFDRNYHPSLSLMHEGYIGRAIQIAEIGNLQVLMLHPV